MNAFESPVVRSLQRAEETFWLNPKLTPFSEADYGHPLTAELVADAAARLQRFAPFIRACFPETEAAGGLIESALTNPLHAAGHACIRSRYHVPQA